MDWPNDLEGARPVFDTLPASLPQVGLGRTAARRAALVAVYGKEDATALVRAVNAADDPPSALAEAASYLMCDPRSREGTAPIQGSTTATADNDVWFSCRVRPTAERKNPGAQVLGWTSGRALWLLEAPDRESLISLVTPMVAAAAGLAGDGPGTAKPPTDVVDPYGLEAASWSTDLDDVYAELAELPDIDRQAPRRSADRESATAEYPSGETILVLRASDGKDASAQLAAGFGLTMTCAPNTFRGTARGIAGGRPDKAPVTAQVRWFSCDVTGAEGDPDFRGHAVGWSYGNLAWLVTGTSAKAARDLVAALVGIAER